MLEDRAGRLNKKLKKPCGNFRVVNNYSHRKRESFALNQGLYMYVCNCNGITEREVRAAVKGGAERWKDVHAYYDFLPQCGKCQCEMIEAIAEYSADELVSGDPIFADPDLVGAT